MAAPARKIRQSAVKNIVRFPAIKAGDGRPILLESILEAKYCLHLEFDPTVVSYQPQPKTFDVVGLNGPTKYTPDFEVLYSSDHRAIVEVKPREKSSSEHYQRIFTSFESTYSSKNTDFVLVNEDDIYVQPLLSNYEKLYRFRKRSAINHKTLIECSNEVGFTKLRLSSVISRFKGRVSTHELYSWLAFGYLKFDIASEFLTLDSEVVFNVD